MRYLATVGCSSSTVGLLFFGIISVPFSAWAHFSACTYATNDCNSFVDNVSWSFSILAIFPFVVALIFRFNIDMHRSLAELAELGKPDSNSRAKLEGHIEKIYHDTGTKFIPFTAAILSATYTAINLFSILNRQHIDWRSNGELFSFLSDYGHGLTAVGLYALLIQAVLIYWVLGFFVKAIVYAAGLSRLFANAVDMLTYQPGHKDRCCGLKKIGETVISMNFVLFLLGVYLSFRLVDKTYMQGLPLLEDLGSLIMMGFYLIAAPLGFYLSVSSTNRYMKKARKTYLQPIETRFRHLMNHLGQTAVGDDVSASQKSLLETGETLTLLRRKVPVWPFRFGYTPGLAIIMPLLSVLISYGLFGLKNLVLVLRAAFYMGPAL